MAMRGEQGLLRNGKKQYNHMTADLFQLFSQSTPLMIVCFLRRRKMTLPEISKNLRMPQKEILPELAALLNKNILVSFNRSQQTFYSLTDDGILRALDLIHKISQKKIIQAETASPAGKACRISRRNRD